MSEKERERKREVAPDKQRRRETKEKALQLGRERERVGKRNIGGVVEGVGLIEFPVTRRCEPFLIGYQPQAH